MRLMTYFTILLFSWLGQQVYAGTKELEQISDTNKEALVILTGFGSKYHSLKAIKKEFGAYPYDVFVPRYISRKSIAATVQNLDEFWKKEGKRISWIDEANNKSELSN